MAALATRQRLLKQIIPQATCKHDLKPLRQLSFPKAHQAPTTRPFSSTPLLPAKGFNAKKKAQEEEEEPPRKYRKNNPPPEEAPEPTGSNSSKKGSKKQKGRRKEESSEDASSQEAAVVEDPFDLSTLEAAIEKALASLRDDLSKLRTGGRFNVDSLKNLRVDVDKAANLRAKLGELADVIPKGGRTVSVIVYEKEHIKPITSSIQASPLGLQPIPHPTAPLELTMPIPPQTKESRDVAALAVSKVRETASTRIRDARAAMQKRLRGMELAKTVRPDDLKKAHKEMEKVVEKSGGEVKKQVDEVRKGVLSG